MTLYGRWAAAVLAALILSLAGNLFAAGLLIGRGLDDRPQGRDRTQGLLASVPDAARPLVRQGLRDRRPEVRARLDALREARRAAFAALRAPQLDKAALTTALAEARQATTAAQVLVDQVLVETASRLPSDERAGWGDPPARQGHHP